jgi:aminoglycoside phosphotransferase (APT) family kinase protein
MSASTLILKDDAEPQRPTGYRGQGVGPGATGFISRNELRAALETVLSAYYGAPRRIERLRRRICSYASSCPICNLEVELIGGLRLDLVFKNLSPDAQLAAAQNVRPGFLYSPMREIHTYRRILQGQGLGTATCYGAFVCSERQRYWLFLERVSGPLLWQRGRLDSWKQAARWLGRLQTVFGAAAPPAHPAAWNHLLRHDEAFFLQWLTRAERFLRSAPASHPKPAWRRFGRVAERYDTAIQRLLQLPAAFTHGEFYPSNILLRAVENGSQICPIDWELAALGPATMDLAALAAGNWEESEKRAMVTAYRQALESGGGRAPSVSDLMEALALCQLHLAVQMLGWAADWSPPEHQAWNWLDTACRLSERINL